MALARVTNTAGTNYASRTTNPGQPWTVCAFYYHVDQITGTDDYIWSMGAGVDNAGLLMFNDDLYSVTDGSNYSAAHVTLTRNSWYFVAQTYDGTNLNTYWKTLAATTLSSGTQTGTFTATDGLFFFQGVSTFGALGRLIAPRVHSAVLTSAQLLLESETLTPLHGDNLWAAYHCFQDDDFFDYSGNARPVTRTGTLATQDSPPVAYGARGSDAMVASVVDTTPSSTDTGTLADAVSGIALPSTDTGTLADTPSLALPSTDSGTGTDAVSGIALAASDAGTLAETVAIAVSTADSGTVSETENVDTGDSTTPSSDDAGTLAETATLTVALTSPDTGTLAETVVGIALASSDQFGQEELVEGTEPITAVEGQTIALSTQSESGTLAETLALALSTAEAATLGEAPALAVSYSVTESGTFTEATLVQQGESNPVDAEAGTFGEFASVAVAVLDGDTGTASEGPAITASYISAETAALIESGGLLNFTGIAGGILSVSARAHGSLGIEA